MKIAAALTYWIIVALWLSVLATVLVHYLRNPRVFGTMRVLLAVVAIDTIRNIIENIYFGLFFGSQYGFFSPEVAEVLGNPFLLILPKLINIAAGCVVLGLLLMNWLPKAIRERMRSEKVRQSLQLLAKEDGLTSLANRRHFDAVARAEWSRFQRYGRPLSLLLLDIDNFKAVNDRFGHQAGDGILKSIARACDAIRRETDVLARIGGEEFAVILPETNEASAAIIAERIRGAIEAMEHHLGEDKLKVTVSVGFAGATLSMSSFDRLLKRADDALYAAKKTGRNRVVQAPREQAAVYKMAAE